MKFSLTILSLLFTLTVFAQEKLEIQGKIPDLYVQHIVIAGESLQSAGARFGVIPAKLAAYNSLDPNAPLQKNTKLRIPLTKDNFIQTRIDNALPVYHIVDKGDNLYRISVNYNKVGAPLLKEWNNLKSDVVKGGQHIIVGFINGHPQAEDKKETRAKPVVSSANVIADLPVISSEKKKAERDVSKPVKQEPVATTPPAAEKEKPLVKESKKEENYKTRDGDEGFFAGGYAAQNANQLKQFRSGDAAIFKTVSGWTDRKYYILMNDAAVGTIVRITTGGNKNICARVLGPLQEAKPVNGLLLRMSNAAAAALGVTDPRFPVSVTYFE